MAAIHTLVFIPVSGEKTLYAGVYQVKETYLPNNTCKLEFKRDVEFDTYELELTLKEGDKAFFCQPSLTERDRMTNVAAFYPTKR